MRQDTITKEIREDFTDADKIEMGASLAEKLVAIATVESEKKSADSVFNERRKVLETEVESLASRYNKGYEMGAGELPPEPGITEVPPTDPPEAA